MRERWAVRLLRAGGALLWLAVWLVGLPAGLVWFAGWPLPDHVPTRLEVERWAVQPLTVKVITAAAVCLMWVLWVWLIYTVFADLLRWLTRLRLPRLRLPAPLHAATSSLAGAAVLAFTATTAGAGATAGPLGVAAPADPHTDQPGNDVGPDGAPDATPEGDGTAQVFWDGYGPGTRVGVAAGVDLPGGGWVSRPLADAVAAAAATIWWQRRRRYLPGQPMFLGRRDDPDLTDLPGTITALQHAADTAPDLPPLAADSDLGGRPRVWPWDLPTGVLGLTGPGAPDAVRGMLTATLLAVSHTPGAGRLLITDADLHAVLGVAPDRYRHLPGLTVADSLDDLFTQSAGTPPNRSTTSNAVVEETTTGAPTLVLLAAVPDRRYRRLMRRFLNTTDHAHNGPPAGDADVTVVVLGACPTGVTWWVDADGTTFSTDTRTTIGPRLSVLPAAATVELLMLITALTSRNPRSVWPADPPTVSAPTQPVGSPTNAARLAATTRTVTAEPALPGAAPLWLRVLGNPQLLRPTDPPTAADTSAAAAWPARAAEEVVLSRSAAMQIAVYLAVHAEGATAAELAAAIWPGVPTTTSRFSTTLSSLRISLEHAAGRPVLRRDADRYHLDPAGIDVDLWHLNAAVDRAAHALDTAGRHAALHDVAATYTDDLAAGQRWTWLPAHREAARRHVIDALSTLATAVPDPLTAVTLLQQAVRHDPHNEHLCRALMRAHAAAGDPDGAALTFRRFSQRLAERGEEPAASTSELARRLTTAAAMTDCGHAVPAPRWSA